VTICHSSRRLLKTYQFYYFYFQFLFNRPFFLLSLCVWLCTLRKKDFLQARCFLSTLIQLHHNTAVSLIYHSIWLKINFSTTEQSLKIQQQAFSIWIWRSACINTGQSALHELQVCECEWNGHLLNPRTSHQSRHSVHSCCIIQRATYNHNCCVDN